MSIPPMNNYDSNSVFYDTTSVTSPSDTKQNAFNLDDLKKSLSDLYGIPISFIESFIFETYPLKEEFEKTISPLKNAQSALQTSTKFHQSFRNEFAAIGGFDESPVSFMFSLIQIDCKNQETLVRLLVAKQNEIKDKIRENSYQLLMNGTKFPALSKEEQSAKSTELGDLWVKLFTYCEDGSLGTSPI